MFKYLLSCNLSNNILMLSLFKIISYTSSYLLNNFEYIRSLTLHNYILEHKY